ncbi:uncharacterized protein LOC117567534 [Drosophila albomicans]|uniref:Uncharacterized protein LOC117567534 n=1 Tax=Drosophila albomicans TaxID=7291 RepID=A0A6P8WIF3_DROAB|nr:uncharacterized protein LOC117567534 [Drosophila albomicans]
MSATKKAKRGVKRSNDGDLVTSTAPPPAKKRMVVTPWRDTEEFGLVYDWLFGNATTPEDIRKALSQMRIWNLRRGSLCPASVLATAVLVHAQLEDKLGNVNIQTTYASAFTRFFNFMSSIMQSYNMSSMYETARQLGLPSFIVDLRHLCAHGQELPPTAILRNTAQHCMKWLHEFYWQPQQVTMKDLDAPKLQRKDKLKFEMKLKSLLDIFDLALECQLKGAQKLKEVRKLKSSAEFNKLRIFCSKHNVKTSSEVLGKVINQLGVVIKQHNTAMKDLLDIYMASVLKMKYFLGAGISHSKDDQEDDVIQATQELFRLLAVQGYILNIFVAFVYLAENPNADTESRQGASYWATKMLHTFGMLGRMKRMYSEEVEINPTTTKPVDFSMYNNPKMTKIMRTLLTHSGVDPTLTLIFGDCPKKPCSWVFEQDFLLNRIGHLSLHSAPILKGLLPLVDPPFSKEQTNDMLTLCDMTIKKCNGETKNDTNDKQQNGHKLDLSKLKTFGLWTLDEDKRWSTCALGVVPLDSASD